MSDSDFIIERLVKAVSPTGKEHGTTLRVRAWNDDQRRSRAYKRLGIWWGCSLGAAIIPPHIPWLSIGLLTGPLAAWLVWRAKGTVLEQPVKCPDCGAPTTIEEQAANWPIGARCEPCRRVFWISQVTPAAETA